MIFAGVSQGSQVFIDANTIVYNATADPRYGSDCKQLMERIARHQIEGFTSVHVLGDVAHRVMTIEAIAQFGWPSKGIAARLRQHPAEIQKLSRFQNAVDEVSQIGIQVFPVDLSIVSQTMALSRQYGLLTGDAL